MNHLWLILIIPVAWFVQNCIHEGSHLLFGWLAEGRDPLVFKPWPHRFEGRFYFARCEMSEAYQLGSPALRHIGPILINGFYAPFTGGLAGFHIFFGIFTLCALVDSLFWVYGYFWGSELSDGKQYRKAVEENK